MSGDASIDVLVVGAGPAGAVAAHGCARRGARVLLVDRARFPRGKVCGCCVNGEALGVLAQEGLAEWLRPLQTAPLREFALHAGGRGVALAYDAGYAISRERFDAALVRAAQAVGARFEDGTAATVHTDGSVTLERDGAGRSLWPRCVVVADGLAGRSLRDHAAFTVTTRRASHVGLGVSLASGSLSPGRVTMACARCGYAGMVRLEDGRSGVAAAVAPAAVREAGGPADAVERILREAGVDAPAGLHAAQWRGTARLTRRRRPLAAPGVFVVGDAAGYVEPFTGQGMAWAIRGGAAVVALALEATRRWHDRTARRWERQYRRLVVRRQWPCTAVAAALRHPAATRAGLAVLEAAPTLAKPIAHHLARPT